MTLYVNMITFILLNSFFSFPIIQEKEKTRYRHDALINYLSEFLVTVLSFVKTDMLQYMIPNIRNEEHVKMKKMSKKQNFVFSLQQNATLFSCPICNENMDIDKDINFTCQNNHSYNIAKQGYIHFLHKSVPSSYDKELFQARQFILSRTALYQAVTKEIVQLIEQFTKAKNPTIVDMGCGEGSHLVNVCQKLSLEAIGIGFDIAKEAILLATNYNDTMLTSVA